MPTHCGSIPEETAVTHNLEDILVWPDGEYCFRYELAGFQHRSDDYRTVAHDSDEWHRMCQEGSF